MHHYTTLCQKKTAITGSMYCDLQYFTQGNVSTGFTHGETFITTLLPSLL